MLMRLTSTRVMRGAASGTTWSPEPTGCDLEIADSKSQLRFSTGSKGGGRTALGVMIGTEDLRAVLQALATRLPGGLQLLAQASNAGAQQSVVEIRSLASNLSLVDASLERPRLR